MAEEIKEPLVGTSKVDDLSEGARVYPAIKGWQAINFMALADGYCEFDEQNIINIKGYNDSGKSAMLQALNVALTNANPSKQKAFIRDGEDFFRVIVTFTDGVTLLRDKYLKGASLYELHKNGECIFSTKVNGELTQITGVPEPIKQYLGLLNYDDICINVRSCKELLLGVETKGSLNAAMFNSLLKAEELSKASELLNNDRNAVKQTTKRIEADLKANQQLMGNKDKLTIDIINYLKEHDTLLDKTSMQERAVQEIVTIIKEIEVIPQIPKLDVVDDMQLKMLSNIAKQVDDLNSLQIAPKLELIETAQLDCVQNIVKLMGDLETLQVAPYIDKVDDKQISDLVSLNSMVSELNRLDVTPQIDSISVSQLSDLQALLELSSALNSINSDINVMDNTIKSLNDEANSLALELETKGLELHRCPSCGELITTNHSHTN